MVLTNGQLPLYAAAGAAQQLFASMGSGDGFEWDPSGVIFGIDFQSDRVFDGETISDDYASVFAGFEPGSVSARGMFIDGVSASTHFPEATGALLDLLATKDFTILIFWEMAAVSTSRVYLLSLLDGSDESFLDIDYDTDDSHASDGNGDWNNVGAPRTLSDNVIAASLNADGVLASLNGATAVLSAPQITTTVERATIAHRDGDNDIYGWIKAIIFYPATATAATLEAYSTHNAPVNTVPPEITGTAQVGQTISVSTGTWTGSPTSYEYQWYRENPHPENIVVGATASSLLLTGAEEGFTMACTVHAINADGISGVAASDDEQVAPE